MGIIFVRFLTLNRNIRNDSRKIITSCSSVYDSIVIRASQSWMLIETQILKLNSLLTTT